MDRKILHADTCPRELAKGWYKRGKREANKDSSLVENNIDEASKDLFRFVSYWIAFNQLYNYNVADIEETTEIERIKDFCDKHMDILTKVLDFDADYVKIFKKKPVLTWAGTADEYLWDSDDAKCYIKKELMRHFKGRKIKNFEKKCEYIAEDYININNKSKPDEDRIKSLLITIYKVRCNLFHGMKTPDPGRDYDLVNSAADVLEICLPDLIEKTYNTWVGDLK